MAACRRSDSVLAVIELLDILDIEMYGLASASYCLQLCLNICVINLRCLCLHFNIRPPRSSLTLIFLLIQLLDLFELITNLIEKSLLFLVRLEKALLVLFL